MTELPQKIEIAIGVGERYFTRTVAEASSSDEAHAQLRRLFADEANIQETSSAARQLIDSELIPQLRSSQNPEQILQAGSHFLETCFQHKKPVAILARTF